MSDLNPTKSLTAELQLSMRLGSVKESATLRLNGMVQKMKAQGIDVANFTTGEPDFPVREEVKQAVISAVHANRSKYTPVAGIPELRQAVADEMSFRQSQLDRWNSSHVVVSNGAKQAIFNALFCLVNPGETVLVPAPYWLSYPEMVRMVGGEPETLQMTVSEGYRLQAEVLASALQKARQESRVVRALFLNSPSNPTGAILSREDLTAIGQVIREHQAQVKETLWVISDEIYDQLVFPGSESVSFLNACPDLVNQTVTINGLSKSDSMTGWRVGWSVTRTDLSKKMEIVQGQMTSGIASLVQWGALAALDLKKNLRAKSQVDSHFEAQLDEYRKRRDRAYAVLSQSQVLDLFMPQGAFYLFVGVNRAFSSGEDSVQYCERVLEKARVALVPGEAFGAPQCVRLSFATDLKTLEEGCQRWVSLG